MARKKKPDREKDLDALVDELLEGERPEDILDEGRLVQELKKRLGERALGGEMTDHLGYEKHSAEGRDCGNSRNGKTCKCVEAGDAMAIPSHPRDRNSDPILVPDGRPLVGVDDTAIALVAPEWKRDDV